MKTIVIYTSQTGFTKRYAEWLAEEMSADLFDLKDVQKNEEGFFAQYEAIVYAGWFCAEKVAKANWFYNKAQNWKNKQLAMIVVGGNTNDNPDTEVAIKRVLTDEQRTYIKAFYCQGGFNYEKMNLPSKLAMKAFVGSLKKSKNAKTREMGERMDHSYDIADKKYLEPVVAYLKEANSEAYSA